MAYGTETNRERRRREGEERNAEWRKLTREQKIAELDRRLGKDVGAARQRRMLSHAG